MRSDRPQLTRDGYERLQAELDDLRRRRTETKAEIAAARADGDLAENAPYHMARQQYGILEGQILVLEKKLDEAEILPDGQEFTEVLAGTTVRVRNEGTGREQVYTLIDTGSQGVANGCVSIDSPIGQALLHLQVGDITEVEAGDEVIEYTILSIEPAT